MFNNINTYSKLLQIAQRNPNNLKRLIVVAPDQPLSLDNIDDIVEEAKAIKHYHVKDEEIAWVNLYLSRDLASIEKIVNSDTASPNPVISLDFSKCAGGATVKRAFLLSLLDKIRTGTTVLVWNYAVQTLPENLIDVFNKVIEPTYYTYKESNKVSLNKGTRPVIINTVPVLDVKHEALDQLLDDSSIYKKSITLADCGAYFDSAYKDLIDGCKLNHSVTKHGLDIWKVDSKVDTYLTIVKDGIGATAEKLIKLFAENQLGAKDIFRIIILSNNSTLVKPLARGLGRVPTSIKLIRSNVFSKMKKENAHELARNLFLKKPTNQYNEPMKIIDLNRCIDFNSINATLDRFKNDGGIVVKAICLDPDTYSSILNNATNGFVNYGNGKGYYIYKDNTSSDPINLFMNALHEFLNSRNWKNSVGGFQFFLFCSVSNLHDIDEIPIHLEVSEYTFKSFEAITAVGSAAFKKRPDFIEPNPAKINNLTVDDLFNQATGLEEPAVLDQQTGGLNKDYIETINQNHPDPEFFQTDRTDEEFVSDDQSSDCVTPINWIDQCLSEGRMNPVGGKNKFTPVMRHWATLEVGVSTVITIKDLTIHPKDLPPHHPTLSNMNPYFDHYSHTESNPEEDGRIVTVVKLIEKFGNQYLDVRMDFIIPHPTDAFDKCWLIMVPRETPEVAIVMECSTRIFTASTFDLRETKIKY